MTSAELIAAVEAYNREHFPADKGGQGCSLAVIADAAGARAVFKGACLSLADALARAGLESDTIGIAVETAAMVLAKHRVDVMDAMPKTPH